MNIRSLPRCFIPGATADGPIELPAEELNKLRHVLRMSSGAAFAVLPNDGTLIHCVLDGKVANPVEVFRPETEPTRQITLAQALPKGDKTEAIIRACTGLGIAKFVLFASDRTIVKWEEKKVEDKLRRLNSIAREEAEVSYRTHLPEIKLVANLAAVLKEFPDASVLSEVQSEAKQLTCTETCLVVGPEGGWAPRELEMIGDRGVTLGRRVLRVEYAGAAAAAKLLL